MAKVKPSDEAQTVIENDVDGEAKSVSLTSPWGSKVTVAAESADLFKDAGYTGTKSK
jgi:hypothetical protein